MILRSVPFLIVPGCIGSVPCCPTPPTRDRLPLINHLGLLKAGSKAAIITNSMTISFPGLSQKTAIILFIIGVKAALFLFSLFAHPLFADETVLPNSHPLPALVHIWTQWDAQWYLSIATDGYQAHPFSIVFFPLYPWLIRMVAYVLHDFQWSAWLVANVASLFGLYFFYRLAEKEYGHPKADYSLMALLFFPTAYFLHAPYTESLFLLTTVGSFYAARQEKWLLSGFIGGLAALTRFAGITLFPALLIEYYLAAHRLGRRTWTSLGLLLIPASFALYLSLNYKLFGSPLAYQTALLANWNKEFAWPWFGLANQLLFIGQFPYGALNVTNGWAEVITFLLFAGGSMVAFYRLRLSYAVFLALGCFISLSTLNLYGTPRYLLSAFPFFFLLGGLGRYSLLAHLLLFFSILNLAVLTLRYTHGLWAF